jgi:hypothetical protein
MKKTPEGRKYLQQGLLREVLKLNLPGAATKQGTWLAAIEGPAGENR